MTVTDRLPVIVVPEDELRIAVGYATDPGGRTENEDAVFVAELPASDVGPATDRASFMMVVADGMGGHQGGEIASRIAIDTLRESIGNGTAADADMAVLMKQAFRRANERIYEQGQAQGDGTAMMGTTLVAATTRGKYATIASVGDSRAYLVRANRLTQITKDHSLVAQQVAEGAITREQARTSPQRNVLMHALGQQPKLDGKLPSIYEITLLPEDRLLLCTDGFYDVATDDDLLQVTLAVDPELAAARLVTLAIERGASDNVTAIVASVSAARVRKAISVGAAGGRSVLEPVLVAIAAILIMAMIAVVYFVL